ncbi:MAG: LTA synthase family protein, partial [Ruminococcus sp.]|nr:LTA synthase family protein [Ruminococcus sp.]
MTNSKNINKQEKQNWITRLNQKREDNSSRFKTLNMILMILFPVFITCMAEINQFKKVSSFFAFAADRPTVLFFDIVIAALVFVFLLAVFRKGWVASVIQSFIYMALSIVELFKYGTNGNHLILSDMKLFKSVKSLKSFAYIRITPRLIIYCLIVVAVALIIAYFNPKLPRHIPVKRLIACLCCVAPCVGLIIFPSFYNPIYKFFKLDTTAATNAFILNEKFDSNSFLAFIVETASESYANRLREPDNYTEDY